jgi:hypothetical protein
MGLINLVYEEAVGWCRGKRWWLRAPFLLWFVYVLAKHLRDPLYSSILGPLNLGIHELGHLLFSFLGQTLAVAGGTIFQLFIPIFAVFNFYRQKDFFAIALSFGWLSTNLFGVATYAADARRLELPLVTPFGSDNAVHDWEFLLSQANALQYDTLIAGLIRVFAVISMLVCFVLGTWLLWQMSRNQLHERTLKPTGRL